MKVRVAKFTGKPLSKLFYGSMKKFFTLLIKIGIIKSERKVLMMKRMVIFFTVCLFLIPCFATPSSAEPEDGYWMLSGTTVDEANSALVEQIANESETVTAHSYEIHAGGGSMSTTTNWQGKEYTVKASFAFIVPDKIRSGETFEINLKVWDDGSDNPDAHISHNMGANASVRNGDSWSSIGSAGAGTQDFQLRENPPKSAMQGETGKEFTGPGKADGFSIRFDIMAGNSPGALYINYDYTYVEGNTTVNPTSGNTNAESNSAAKPTTTAKNSALKDAGCVFSDLAGQVEVLNPIGYDENGEPLYDEEAWHFAKLDEPLYAGTKIKTGSDNADNPSMAIISFADMSTFVLQPLTTIELVSPNKKESKVKLALGNIWVNVKKMVTDGTMEIEMSQAAAGIRGTIFVCEVKEDGTSTLKVIEGDVRYTDKATGAVTSVTDGKMIASGPQAAALTDFDIKAEHAKWQKYDSDLAITNKSGPAAFIIAAIIVVFIVIGGVFAIFIKKRNSGKP